MLGGLLILRDGLYTRLRVHTCSGWAHTQGGLIHGWDAVILRGGLYSGVGSYSVWAN